VTENSNFGHFGKRKSFIYAGFGDRVFEKSPFSVSLSTLDYRYLWQQKRRYGRSPHGGCLWIVELSSETGCISDDLEKRKRQMAQLQKPSRR
jgi:hypothetical protein